MLRLIDAIEHRVASSYPGEVTENCGLPGPIRTKQHCYHTIFESEVRHVHDGAILGDRDAKNCHGPKGLWPHLPRSRFTPRLSNKRTTPAATAAPNMPRRLS